MRKKNIKAIVLVSVLLLILLLLIMSVSMITMSSNFLAFIGGSETSGRALIASYAGIEYAVYRLNNDPNWGVRDLDFTPTSSASIPDYIPEYNADTSAEAKVKLTGSEFIITFGTSYGSKYQSVNNLFGNTAKGEVPPYTAEIISTGKCGNDKKVVKAYLTRSDFYPYAINSENSIVFVEGKYNIKGDSSTGQQGDIYSSWAGDENDKFSIQLYPGVKKLSCNGGILLGKGPINIMDSQIDNTKFKERCIPELYLSKIDVSSLLSNASNYQYGNYVAINPGMATIKEQPPPAPNPPPRPGESDIEDLINQLKDRLTAEAADQTTTNGPSVTISGSDDITASSDPEYSKFIIDGGGTNFDNVASFDPNQIISQSSRGIIKLNSDIVVGNSDINGGDRNEYLYDSTFKTKANNPGSNNIFRIFRNGSSDLFKTYTYKYTYTYKMDLTYTPPQDIPIYSTDPNGNTYISGYSHIDATSSETHSSVCDAGTESPYNQQINYIKLNLNGHNIYSRSHLILGVELIGTGRIIADGKIACLFGENSDQITCISRDDLHVELSNNFVESNNKGFYYAGDDLSIRPMNSDSLLATGTAGNPSGTREVMHYPPGYRLNDSDQIIIGNYDNGTQDYRGNGIKADSKSHNGYITVAGWDVSRGNNSNAHELQFYYNKSQQITLPDGAKILVPASGTESPKIVDSDDNDITISTGVSSSILSSFASFIQNEFSRTDIRYYKATLNSTSVSLNSFPSAYGANYQNVSPIDTGSQEGEIYLIQNSNYMEHILNIERTNFKVRKVSCIEME
jgi:hypothetical protein